MLLEINNFLTNKSYSQVRVLTRSLDWNILKPDHKQLDFQSTQTTAAIAVPNLNNTTTTQNKQNNNMALYERLIFLNNIDTRFNFC